MDGYLHLDNNNLQAAIKLLTHPQVDLDFAPEILNLLVKRGEYNMAMQIVDGQRVGTWTPKVAQAVLTALQHVDFTHALKHVDLYRSLLSPDSFTRLVEYQLQMPDKSGVHDLLAAEYSSEQEEQLLAYCAKTRHHNHLARDFMVAYLVQKHKYADAIHALEAQYDERGDQARIRDLQLISDDLRRVLGPVQRLVFDAQNGARLIRSKTVDMPLDYQVEKVLQNLATPNTSTADRAMQQDDTVESLKNTQVTSPFLQPPLTPNRQVKQRAQVLSATRSAESRLPKFNMTADSRSSSVSPTRERISALPSKEMFRNVLPPRQAQVGSGIMAGILGESPKQFFGKSPARKSPAHTNDRSPSPMGFVKDRSPSPMVSVRDRSPSPMIPLRDRSPSPIIAGKDRSPSPMMPVKEQVPSPRAMIKDRTPSPMYHVKESPMIHRKERSPSPMQQSPTRHSPLRAIISESHDQMQVDRESNQSPVSQTQDSMVVDNTDIFPDQPSAIEYPSLDMNAESMLINIPFSEEHVGHAWLDTPTVETDEQEHAPSTPASARQPEPAKRVNEPFGGKLLQKVASPTPARAIQPTIEVPTLANPLLVNRSPFVEQKKRPVRKLAAPPAHLIESFVAKTPVRTSTRLLKQLESGLRQSTPKITNKYGKGKTRSRVAGYSSSEEDVDMDQQGKGKAFDDEAVEKRQTSKRTPAKPLSRTMTPVRLERVGSEESVTDGIGDAHVSWTRSRSNTPKPDPEPATPIAPPSKSRKRVLAHPPKSLKNDMNLLKKREKEQDESPSISDKLDRRMMTRRLASQMKE